MCIIPGGRVVLGVLGTWACGVGSLLMRVGCFGLGWCLEGRGGKLGRYPAPMVWLGLVGIVNMF